MLYVIIFNALNDTIYQYIMYLLYFNLIIISIAAFKTDIDLKKNNYRKNV